MITIKAKAIKSDDGLDVIEPEEKIPSAHKARYINGEFQAIPENEDWPENIIKK